MRADEADEASPLPRLSSLRIASAASATADTDDVTQDMRARLIDNALTAAEESIGFAQNADNEAGRSAHVHAAVVSLMVVLRVEDRRQSASPRAALHPTDPEPTRQRR